MTEDDQTLLTGFQLDVAQLFFALPASAGFLLAGGAALLAQHLTQRPTQDLDFFTQPGAGDVPRAREEFTAAAARRGWQVETVQDGPSFCQPLEHPVPVSARNRSPLGNAGVALPCRRPNSSHIGHDRMQRQIRARGRQREIGFGRGRVPG